MAVRVAAPIRSDGHQKSDQDHASQGKVELHTSEPLFDRF